MSADHYGRAPYDSNSEPVDDEEHRHTQFLDLTNGEGGERVMYYTDSEEDIEEEPTEIPLPQQPNSNNAARAARGGLVTLSGRVVESGQEHTGRWTREEHEAFLTALNTYGKEWKKVAAKVKTRTVVQTRTHAQKYFQKLSKSMGGDGSGDGSLNGDAEVGVVAQEVKKASAQKKQRLKARSQSTTSAAHLLTHLPSIPSQQVSAPASASVYSSSYTTHGFAPASSLADLPPPPAYTPPPPAYTPPPLPTSFYGGGDTSLWGSGATTMSIVAPDHETAMRRGFPEPSPAASGKRKLAELAAAQMLAGVAAGGSPPQQHPAAAAALQLHDNHLEGDMTPPPSQELTPCRYTSPPRAVGGGLSLQIVNPETLGITYNETRKRISRQGEPETPWDGQLEQLVTDDKMKEKPIESAVSLPSMLSDHAGNPFSHPVCGPGSSYGRSPIHKAVCEMDMAAVHQELSDSIGAASLHRKDEAGFYPIHSACSLSLSDPENSSIACEITRLLIAAGGDASAVDNKRNTPLHWAARSGDADASQLLLMRNCPPDAQNDDGDTALHWAMRAGRRGMGVVRVLVENGSRPAILNNTFKRAVDVAVDGFVDAKNYIRLDGDAKKNSGNKNKARADTKKRQLELIEEKQHVRAHLLALSFQSRTLVLHHPECLEHIPKAESDWECPDRVVSIMRRVVPHDDSTETTGIFPHEVTVSTEFDRAKLDFLSRVHSSDYLSFVNDLSKELTKRKEGDGDGDDDSGMGRGEVVPFTPMVQKTVMKDFGVHVKKDSHSDTSFSAGSLRAARRAAGAVQHAVDCVLVGRHRNAFCVVRPPGHHAGVKGLLAGGESCGFCIFNNVAAGALHAISDERLMCQRCAIVDIDVHHGNGTEEIVKRCHDPGKLLFFSIHLHDNEKRKNGYSFYPGTGDEDDIAHNIINVPIAPMWREQVQSPTGSVSSHNTRHKAKRKAEESGPAGSTVNDDTSEAGAVSTAELPETIDTESESASMKGSAHGSTAQSSAKSPRTQAASMGRAAYRRAIQNRLLPSLRAFNPDLILISTGFDAAKGDVGNARHFAAGKERMGLDLEPEDYAWTTRKILEIADICCQGRVVSVLEGGYGRSPVMPPPGALGGSNSLDKAFFSECAIRHLHAMIDPYDTESRFGRDRGTS